MQGLNEPQLYHGEFRSKTDGFMLDTSRPPEHSRQWGEHSRQTEQLALRADGKMKTFGERILFTFQMPFGTSGTTVQFPAAAKNK